MNDILPLLIQIPLVGLFGWFVVKMVASVKSYIETREAAWQTVLKDHSSVVGEQLKALTRQTAINTAVLLQHDATVRGINPDSLGTTSDLIARILGDD